MLSTEFELSDTGKEYPVRFASQKVTLLAPETEEELRGCIQDGVDFWKALIGPGNGTVNGQGYILTKQKRVKDWLGSDKVTPETPIEEALRAAVEYAEAFKIGEPTTRGPSKAGGKIAAAEAGRAQAEAKVDAHKQFLRTQYLKMNKQVRAALRADIIEHAVFTPEELAEFDAEVATK